MPTFKIHVLTVNSINSLSDFSLFIAFTSKMEYQPVRSTWIWLWLSVGDGQQFSTLCL